MYNKISFFANDLKILEKTKKGRLALKKGGYPPFL